MNILYVLFAAAILMLGGCAAKPYAIIDGTRAKISDGDNFDVNIISIDGKMNFQGDVVNVEPGFHNINLRTTKKLKSKVSDLQVFPVFAKECFRYEISAQHRSSLSDEWEIKVLREVEIPSCTPSDKELEPEVLPSYLLASYGPEQAASCIAIKDLNNSLSPVYVYPSLKKCIDEKQESDAIYNYILASAYGMYDAGQVIDQTAHQAIEVIQKHSTWTLSALEQANFEAVLTSFINTPKSMQSACAFLRSVGKPGYIPEYMVEHGVLKLNADNPTGIAQDVDKDKLWQSILTEQLKCT